MQAIKIIFALLLSLAAGLAVAHGDEGHGKAGLETVTLDVEGMTCRMCPITVKKALRRVPGVVSVEAEYEGDGMGWAKVTFDPRKARLDDLLAATERAGYPARPKE